MFKGLWYLDIKLRLYCFILRAELEIITRRKPGIYWPKIYSIVNNNDRNARQALYNMYVIHHRKFIKNTIEWIDYFTALYDRAYLNANQGTADNA